MRKKIGGRKVPALTVIVLFVLTLLVVPGYTIAERADTSLYGTPHRPGFVQSVDELVPVHVERRVPPRIPLSTVSSDIDIVELLQQLDETLILGYLENLTAFGPRVTGTDACEQAGYYLYETFQEMGLETRFHNYTDNVVSGSNIEATLYGVNDSSIFIVCAHYDSVPGSPGADDDGSGVAAVLAAAKIMSNYQFSQTVRFITFSGEEQGLIGSRHYARDAYENNEPIIAVLNADMIGFALTETDGSLGKIFHNAASQWIVTFTQHISLLYEDYIGIQLIPQGESWGSDHYYFWQYGYDAVFYHEWNFNDYYHSPGDTIEHMNLSYSTRFSRLILATLAEMAIQPRALLQVGNIMGGRGVSCEVLNIGSADALDVNVTISITGGLFGFLQITETNGIPLLKGSETLAVEATFFRLGWISVTVIAEASNAAQVTKKATGFVFGPFVFRLNGAP